MSDHLRRQRHDLHELLVAQLPAHRAEDAGRPRLALIGDQHGGVLVEPDVGAVPALGLLGRPHDHGLRHFPLLDLPRGNGVLDRDDHDVAESRVAPLGPAEHADDERFPRARIVRDLEYRFLLYHGPLRPLLRPLENLDHPPALRLRERARLLHPDGVSGLGPLLVVGRHCLGADHLLPVEAVGVAAHQRHRHGLLSLVARHHARPRLPPGPHACLPATARSRRMVSMRAMSRRIKRNCSGFVIASVPARNRRRNRSSRSTASFCSSFTNFDRRGSFAAASVSAWRASDSSIPSTSNITRPGFTTATHPSGLPFPFPIRVSAGFLVIGLSGNNRIHTFPPRFISRVSATRAASIWRLVIQPGSSDISPKCPNATVLPRVASPLVLPLNRLRNLTRLGASIVRRPSSRCGPPAPQSAHP